MSEISNQLENLSYKAQQIANEASQLASSVAETSGGHSDFIIFGITVLVLALVFAISMPIVNKLMTRFLPFLMKNGEGSMLVVGVKALVVALVFFTVKKLLL